MKASDGRSPMVKCMKSTHGNVTLKHSVARLYIWPIFAKRSSSTVNTGESPNIIGCPLGARDCDW